MKATPIVSVITSFLNAVAFIEEAIESVLAQTYADWELLLIDDGSNDGSTQIALRFAAKYPKQVRYLEHAGHQNQGASAARNLGIQHARGRYIALLDADDIWLPHKLAQQVKILSAQPEAAMLFGNTQYWYSWTGRAEDAHSDHLEGIGVEPDTLITPPTLLTRILQQKVPVPCTCSVLLRREAVENIGGFEESFRRVFTDQVFYAKLLLRWPALGSNETWDKYRRHPASCVSTVESEGGLAAARFKFLAWLEEYLLAQGFKGTEVWHALQAALWPYRHPRLSAFIKDARTVLTQQGENLKALTRRTLPRPIYTWLKNRKNNLRRQTS